MLSTLTLSGNHLGDHGTDALAHNLMHGTHQLTTIDLSSNGIGDNGAMAMRVLLESKATLQKVNMNRNKVGNLGAWALFLGSSKSQAGARVFLKNNNVDAEMQNEIKRQKGGNRLFV